MITEKTTTYSAFYDIVLNTVERPQKASERYGQQKVDTTTLNKNYKFVFEDDLVKILWSAGSRELAFSLENKTDHSIKIPWDEAAYVDENGKSQRVIHSGVKYSERQSHQPPSVIVRKGSIEDIIQPTNKIYYREGYYGTYVSNPGSWEENPLLTDMLLQTTYNNTDEYSFVPLDEFKSLVESNVGKTYQVLLPLQIEDVINDYIFTFKINSVIVEMDTSLFEY